MAEATLIEWTDATQNFHIGCQKVGPGCEFCYAEASNVRFHGGENWGPGAPRRRTSAALWNNPLKWQRQADAFEAEHGRRRRVFASSLSDIMDNAIPIEETREAFGIMETCDRLDWQLLTKRVGNVETRVPEHWTEGRWPRHVGLMITVVNQAEADRDIPKVLARKARFGIPWVGISYEPALGPVDFTDIEVTPGQFINALCCEEGEEECASEPWGTATIDWIVAGGESGPSARPAHPEWFHAVRNQCAAAGIAFLFKQWGEWKPESWVHYHSPFGPKCVAIRRDGVIARTRDELAPTHNYEMHRVGKKRAGRLLDGRIHNQFPDFTGSAPRAPQGQVAAGR